ncbi:MAG: hypothetical protein LBT59_20590 [Clostridiales bacterium]|jgi:hypothetical protein|nr:hypothetical protein [Clostridiales bacterium]
MRRVLGVAIADFKERRRRFSFLAVVALSLLSTALTLPGNKLGMVMVYLEPEKLLQGGNATWLMLSGAAVPYYMFFFILGNIEHDEKTKVRDMAKCSALSDFSYCLGKFISNVFVVLSSMTAVVAGSIAIALIRFPGDPIPWSVLTVNIPFIPALLFMAAVVLFCETTVMLRKMWSVAVYLVMVSVAVTSVELGMSNLKYLDMTGLSELMEYVRKEMLEKTGLPLVSFHMFGVSSVKPTGTKQIYFGPWAMNLAHAVTFGIKIALSGILVYLSSVALKISEKAHKPKLAALPQAEEAFSGFGTYEPAKFISRGNAMLGISAELRLMFSGKNLFWKAVAIAGLIALAFAPMEVASAIAPLELVWCIRLFSGMGSREHIHGTINCVAVIPNGKKRQMLYSWAAGTLIALGAVSPALFRLLATSNYLAAFSCAVGALFVPSIALFLGEWTKTQRVFEIVMVVLTYAVISNVSIVYMELRPSYISASALWVLFVASVLAGVLAIAKRAGFGAKLEAKLAGF